MKLSTKEIQEMTGLSRTAIYNNSKKEGWPVENQRMNNGGIRKVFDVPDNFIKEKSIVTDSNPRQQSGK